MSAADYQEIVSTDLCLLTETEVQAALVAVIRDAAEALDVSPQQALRMPVILGPTLLALATLLHTSLPSDLLGILT